MPTQEHDVLADIFRSQPKLAAQVVADLGVEVPRYTKAREGSESFTDLKTSEYTGDAVVLLEDDEVQFGVVIEVQRSQDPRKHYTWPLYLATLRARQRCPAALLVIAPDPKIAKWCSQTIETGHPDHTLTPVVLESRCVPVITDGQRIKEDPARAVLSAAFHGEGREAAKVLQGVLDGTAAIRKTDRDKARHYYELVTSVLSEAARRRLEDMLETDPRYRSKVWDSILAEGLAEGLAQGEAKAVITVLDARGIQVPEDARERIVGCTDIAQLDVWLKRAVTITEVEELFN